MVYMGRKLVLHITLQKLSMWVKFVVGSLLAPRGFSPGTPVFPSFSKTNTAKFQFDPKCTECALSLKMKEKQFVLFLGKELFLLFKCANHMFRPGWHIKDVGVNDIK